MNTDKEGKANSQLAKPLSNSNGKNVCNQFNILNITNFKFEGFGKTYDLLIHCLYLLYILLWILNKVLGRKDFNMYLRCNSIYL